MEFIEVRSRHAFLEVPEAYQVENDFENEDAYGYVPESYSCFESHLERLIEPEEEESPVTWQAPWPQAQVRRPPIASLIQFSALPMKKPEPLPPSFLAFANENKKECEAAAKDLSKAESVLSNLNEELAKLQEQSKGVNKWSMNRAKSEAQLKKIQADLLVAMEAKKVASTQYDTLTKKGYNVKQLVSCQKEMEANWKEYCKLLGTSSE